MENSGIPKLLFQQILLLPQFIFTKIYDSKNKSKKDKPGFGFQYPLIADSNHSPLCYCLGHFFMLS